MKRYIMEAEEDRHISNFPWVESSEDENGDWAKYEDAKELENKLAAMTDRAEKAEAACAEMREILGDVSPAGYDDRIVDRIEVVMMGNAGKDWVSPTKLSEIIKARDDAEEYQESRYGQNS